MIGGAWLVYIFHDSDSTNQITREVIHLGWLGPFPLMSKGERRLMFGEEFLERTLVTRLGVCRCI